MFKKLVAMNRILLTDASELAFSVIFGTRNYFCLIRRLREHIKIFADYRIIKKNNMNDMNDATVLQITPSVFTIG
jgi:hypothetical protein